MRSQPFETGVPATPGLIWQLRGRSRGIVRCYMDACSGGCAIRLMRDDNELFSERYHTGAEAMGRAAAIQTELIGKGWSKPRPVF